MCWGGVSVRILALVSSGLLLSACTAPPLSHATNNFPFSSGIPIHDVVQRVKCDLTQALFDKLYVDKDRDKLKWMRNWTAKADLTFEANETGGITPNLAFVQPMKNAFFLGAGPNSINTATGAVTTVASATAQSFTFGVAGTFSGQATRTETLSFTVSLAELKRWGEARLARIARGEILTGADSCAPSAPTDLQASLDLKPWLDEVLKPVIAEELESGIHPDPGQAKAGATASRSAAPAGTRQSAFIETPKETLKANEKLGLDLELATALAELGVEYDTSKYKTPDPKNKEPDCASTTASDGTVLGAQPPPPYPGGANPNSLPQQALTAAQSAQSTAQQASVMDNLEPKIVTEIQEAANAARDQAVQVRTAALYARQSVYEYCTSEGASYLIGGTASCRSDGKLVAIQLSPQYCDAKEYRSYMAELRAKQLQPAQKIATAAQQNSQLATKLLTPDPPVESIGQSLNFVVTLGINDSPNWILLRLKGPANGGSFGSLSGIRTHTLNIALGAPTQSGVAEVSRVLANQAIRQAIQGIPGAQ